MITGPLVVVLLAGLVVNVIAAGCGNTSLSQPANHRYCAYLKQVVIDTRSPLYLENIPIVRVEPGHVLFQGKQQHNHFEVVKSE